VVFEKKGLTSEKNPRAGKVAKIGKIKNRKKENSKLFQMSARGEGGDWGQNGVGGLRAHQQGVGEQRSDMTKKARPKN